MSTISHPPSGALGEQDHLSWQWFSREMWASLAIVAMWVAVLFTAIFGPNMITQSAGGDGATIPSAVVVALFASLGTWAVAKYGFGHHRKHGDRAS